MLNRLSTSFSPVCPPNDQLFISNSRSLLPLENVQASSESLTFPIANILSPNAAATWCTNAPSFIGEHVNFTFTEPVVLTMIVSSSAFPSHYVNNFSIAYSSSEDSNGSSFDIYGVTSMPQVSCPKLLSLTLIMILCILSAGLSTPFSTSKIFYF